MCCASAVIIVISNHHAANWKWPPSVLLGLLASIASALLVIALSAGATITWWRAALDGTSLNRLHYIWDYGSSALGTLLFGWRHINKVGVAAVITAITGVAYSPLLQKASYTDNIEVTTNLNLSIHALPVIPDTMFATVSFSSDVPVTNANFTLSRLSQKVYNGTDPTTLYEPGYACNGACNGWVNVTGISSTCTDTKSIGDLFAGVDGFTISVQRFNDAASIPTLNLTIQRVDSVDSKCSATMVTRQCLVTSGTVLYPVTLENITIKRDYGRQISSFKQNTWPGDAVLTSPDDVRAGPLAMLHWYTNNYYSASDPIVYSNHTDGLVDYSGGIAPLQWYDYSYADSAPATPRACAYRWNDPSSTILDQFSQVLFAASLVGANGTYTELFQTMQVMPTLVYISLYRYLAAGSALLLLAIIAICSTLYGWWQLGREVSLSPLETAKAFGANVFESVHEFKPKALAKAMKDDTFKYGYEKVNGRDEEVLQIHKVSDGHDVVHPKAHK